MDHLLAHLEHRSVATSPAATAGGRSADPGLLTWAELVAHVRRSRLIVLGTSLGFAFLVFMTVTLFQSQKYEAVATLVIAPQRFGSELTAAAPPVEEYQGLLESHAVVAETSDRLRDAGLVEDDKPLRIREQLTTRIIVSPSEEDAILAPMVEVVAEASTAEAAATIANTWSAVFLEQVWKIHAENVAPAIDLIESGFQEERERLIELAAEETRLVNEYQTRLDEFSLAWDRRRVEAQKKTEDLIVEHNVGSRRMIEELAAGAGLHRVPERAIEATGDSARGDWPGELEKKLRQIVVLRTQLAQTPRLLDLESAITEDELWQSTALRLAEVSGLQPLFGPRRITEDADAIYIQLTRQLFEIERELGSMSWQEAYRIRRFTADLERVQADRVAGLTKMLFDRRQLMDDLERQRSREVQALLQEREMRLEEVAADIAQQRSLFTQLADQYNSLSLGDAEQALRRVRVAAPAVPPRSPKPREGLLMTLVAAFVGAIFGLVIAVVRHHASAD